MDSFRLLSKSWRCSACSHLLREALLWLLPSSFSFSWGTLFPFWFPDFISIFLTLWWFSFLSNHWLLTLHSNFLLRVKECFHTVLLHVVHEYIIALFYCFTVLLLATFLDDSTRLCVALNGSALLSRYCPNTCTYYAQRSWCSIRTYSICFAYSCRRVQCILVFCWARASSWISSSGASNPRAL